MLLMTVLTFASACLIGKQQQMTHDVDFFESLMKIKLKKIKSQSQKDDFFIKLFVRSI